ncbi:MAG: hypothetical protein GVY26_17230 [Bacteroidetes bacterium]|jgi:hypothetical protein|nr:hypothetical protein [Bacteroidota bacterium]
MLFKVSPNRAVVRAGHLLAAAKFGFILLLLVFMGCEKNNQPLSPESQDSEAKAIETRTSSTDLYRYYDNVALFYDQSEAVVYYLLYDAIPSDQIQANNIEVVGKYDNPVKLKVRDIKSGTVYEHTLSADIYGIGLADGASSVEAILEQTQGGGYVLPDVIDGTEVIVCNCFESGETLPDNCDHGGAGSSGCSVTESTPMYEISCSVDCNSSHVACCTADANWNYGD